MLKLKEDNYNQFTVQERVNLTIAAFSRGDSKEVNRLYKSCPQYTYQATDYEFTKRIDAITWVGEKYAELCQYFYDKILLSESVIAGQILSLLKHETTTSEIQEIQMYHICNLKSVHHALIKFCNEIDIDSNQLINWMTLAEDRKGINKYLAFDLVEHDKEFTLYIKNKFLFRFEKQ